MIRKNKESGQEAFVLCGLIFFFPPALLRCN